LSEVFVNPSRRKWTKIILWSIGGLVVLVIALVVTAVLLVEYNSGVRQRILAKVESSVQESTGARLQVRDFNLHLRDLSLDLWGITVHGSEADPNTPLLTTDHINVGIKILSLMHAKWRLQDVIIDHPVVHVFVNKAGENNLPKPKQKSSSSNTNLFDLAIQKFVLDRGEVYYNDKKSVMDAELHDFSVNAVFDNSQSRYFGDLSYRQGRIQYGTYAPVMHDLQAHFEATPTRFDLDQLVLATGGSKVTVKAAVEDYSNPKMQASYNAVLVADDFRRILKNRSIPTGVISLEGSLNYQSDPNRPMLETVSLNGTVGSRELTMKTPSIHAQARDLGAHYKLEGGNAEVENIHANLLGGRLDGKLVIRDLAGNSHARFQAALKDISLEQAAAVTGNQSSLRQANLSGKFNANADATWGKTLKNLVAHSDATIQAAIGGGKTSAGTPLNGAIHADYTAANQQIALNQSYIKTPQTTITLNGRVSQNSQLAVRMHSNNLHEIELLADTFRKPTPGQPPGSPARAGFARDGVEAQQEMGLYGTATLNASVTGSTSNPQITGQLVASNLKVKGSSWKVLRTNITANPSLASLTNGDLEAATRGRITFNVQTRLKHWAYTASNPINVQLAASQLSVADLERLANQTYPVSGILSVNVSVHGSQLNPVGQGTINLVNAKVSDEPIQSINVHFQGNGEAVSANLNIKMPAGNPEATLTYYPKTEAYQAQVQAKNFRIEKLQTVQARNMQVNGGLDLEANGRGTLKSPELTASLRIPVLQVQKQTIRGIAFNTDVHNHVANLSLNTEVAETYLKASGTVGIDAPYNANLKLDTGRILFQPLIAMYAPAQAANMGGETELHATLRGPLKEKSRIEAHIEVPVLAANYKQVKVAAVKPIRLDYQNEVATLQPTAIQGTGTDIQMQGRLPINDRKDASFLVQGTIDLQLAQMLVPDVQSSGQLKFDINSQKYGNGGNIEGQIRVVNANFQALEAPLGLSNGNGVITVTRDRLQIVSLEGQVGGGTIRAKGGVAYHPSVQFDLGFTADKIRLRYPEGIRAVLGSNLSLTGTTEAGVLSGQVLIQHVSFTPDFDLSTFISQFTGESSSPPSQGMAQNIKLNIALQSTSQMNLVSSQVSMQGNANLRVVGTAADPVILGRATLSGGELFMAGKRFIIQEGTVAFLNPVQTEPVVNLQVNTTIEQYNIALHFEGPIEHLRTNYTSDPSLPPVDIINLLVKGQTTEEANANPTPGTLGAESLVAGQITSQVSGKIQKFAGISNLSIDPTLGGDQGNPGARIAIQQRVTGNLFVTFATDVTSTQRQEIQVEYKFNPRWSVSADRDQNGGFGVDGKYHKAF
jgi:translocation and assembly module TamB